MAKVYTTMGVDDQVKTLWKELADSKGRSMAGYMEWMIMRESELLKNGGLTLESILQKLESIEECCKKNEEYFSIICKKLDENNTKSKKKTDNTDKKEKEKPIEAWQDCGVCTQESWGRWLEHLRKCGKPVNFYLAQKQFSKLKLIHKDKWDCDYLIEHLINEGHGTFYVPVAWMKEEM